MSFPGSILLTDEHIRTSGLVKKHPLGTRGYTLDGRAFRYALNGAAALEAGDLVTGVVPVAWANSTNTSGYQDLGFTTTWAALTISCTCLAGGSATANSFADGYIWTQSTEGAGGQLLRVLSNTTCDTGTASQMATFTLHPDSRLTEDQTTETRYAVMRNPYSGVITIPGAAAPTSITLGVASKNVTIAHYFWLQTWGPCPVDLESAAIVPGEAVVRATSTGVTIPTTGADLIDQAIVGVAMSPANASANEFGLIFLTLNP